MSFFNKLGKDLGTAAEKAKFEADKALKVNRMSSELGDLTNRVQQTTASIGQKVMEMHSAGQLQVPELEELFNQVHALQAQADAKKTELEALRAHQFSAAAAPVAPAAAPTGGPAPAPFSFGPTEPAASGAAPAGEDAVPKFCPSCGAASQGAKFCPGCGTKLG